MDIPSIAGELTKLLAPALPYLTGLAGKAGETIAGEIAKDTWAAAKELWARIGKKVEAKDAALGAVQELAKDPDKALYREVLRDQLEEILHADVALAGDVGQLLINTGVLEQTQITTTATDNATVIHFHGDFTQNVTKILQAMNVEPEEDLRQATEAYLEFLLERYQSLDFRGMGVSDKVP